MKKAKLPNIVTVLIFSLATSVLWLFFGIYRAVTKLQPTSVPEEVLTPLNPSLDSQILQEIEKRGYIDENQMPQQAVTAPNETPSLQNPLPTPETLIEITTTPSASPSANPSSMLQ
jgi:hypothetical protein